MPRVHNKRHVLCLSNVQAQNPGSSINGGLGCHSLNGHALSVFGISLTTIFMLLLLYCKAGFGTRTQNLMITNHVRYHCANPAKKQTMGLEPTTSVWKTEVLPITPRLHISPPSIIAHGCKPCTPITGGHPRYRSGGWAYSPRKESPKVTWRRKRDLNTRSLRPLVFKTSALNHSAIPANKRQPLNKS